MLDKCSGLFECESDDEINNFFKSHFIGIAYRDNFLKNSDINDPIKSYRKYETFEIKNKFSVENKSLTLSKLDSYNKLISLGGLRDPTTTYFTSDISSSV